jgi:hypothetical protein
VHIKASSAVCVMLQCFPALIISKFEPYCSIETYVQSNSCFVCGTYFVFMNGRLKHRYNLIQVLCMKRILFFTNELFETGTT